MEVMVFFKDHLRINAMRDKAHEMMSHDTRTPTEIRADFAIIAAEMDGSKQKSSTDTIFTDESLRAFQHVASIGAQKNKSVVSDSQVPGLRAIVRPSGQVSFHVSYYIADTRPYWKIGDYPEMSIEEARSMARTILALSAKGIDPAAESLKRVFRELREQGADWKP